MASTISWEQALSQLMRCSFKQYTSKHHFLHPNAPCTHKISREARPFSTRPWLRTTRYTSEQSNGSFVPSEINPTLSRPLSSNLESTPRRTPPSISWTSQPDTSDSASSTVTNRGLKPPTNVKPGNPVRKRVRRAQEAKEIPATTAREAKPRSGREPPKPQSPTVKEREEWMLQKAALQEKFTDQPWSPRKKLSPDALEGIRAMHAQYPDHFTTPLLADHFKVSPEAIRRILKSKWKPKPEEEEDRRKRWERRGEKIWEELAEKKGMHPPKKWRDKGIAAEIPRYPSGQLRVPRVRVGDVRSRDGTARTGARRWESAARA